jgi:predicted PurR-regulated permease PerM
MEQSDINAINRLSKSLRTIKVMLALFLVMLVANLLVLGFVAWKVLSFTHDISNRVNKIQNSVLHIPGLGSNGASSSQQNSDAQTQDLKNKLCGNPSVQQFLGSSADDICKH